MYLDAMEFLEEEREAWRPFEALSELEDAELERQSEGTHGWSGRDLMGHLVGWQEVALQIAKELAVGETSASAARVDADWDARGEVVINAEMQAAWAELPLDDVRRRFSSVAGEVRGYLTVVPEARWIKNPKNMESIAECTVDHYQDHLADLEAILSPASPSPAPDT
ncbi:MAG: hypothetical protein E6H96_08850 [Chloroflexi bacterium]|nr:MAG: hypothetical protein E6H96_08850 [Chloroflexota bacterium]